MLKIIIYILLVFSAALIGFLIPIMKKKFKIGTKFDSLEALATGVFLGAATIHLIPDAISQFDAIRPNIEYPVVMLIVGSVFLTFLFIEHLFAYINHKRFGSTINLANHEIEITTNPQPKKILQEGSLILACGTTLALSLHSFFTGAALGISKEKSSEILLLIAIMSHKTSASLALTIELWKTKATTVRKVILFSIFALATPLGIILGYELKLNLEDNIIVPILIAFSAGTFLFLGTIHGLSKSVLGSKCCDFKVFSFAIIGFAIMAIVAIWT